MADRVAVALVEGEANEAPLVVFSQAPYRFIEADDVEPSLLDLIEHGFEKFRGDLEATVRREGFLLLRPYLIEREDHARPLGIGGEQPVRAAAIEAGQGGSGHGGLHAHRAAFPRKDLRRSPALCA